MGKKIIIVGATSGIGEALCHLFVKDGWKVGIAGRREDCLKKIAHTNSKSIVFQKIDICSSTAEKELLQLVDKLGGMDYYLHVSGIGFENMVLRTQKEINIVETNVTGFVRMVDTAYNYFKSKKGGHIAVISSVAATKGLGVAPAYSASKIFDDHYIQALSQLANIRKHPITFTNIKPGFIDTPILSADKSYPFMMSLPYASRIIFKAILKKKRVKIVDWRYAAFVYLLRLVPNRLWERLKISL